MDTLDHISPWFEQTGHPRWKYRTTRPLRFPGLSCSFSVRSVKSGRELAAVSTEQTIIHQAYFFDGVTGFLDMPQLMSAALVHDLYCQCLGHSGWPLGRSETDLAFLREGVNYAPVMARLCYLGLVAYRRGPYALAPKKPDPAVRLVSLT